LDATEINVIKIEQFIQQCKKVKPKLIHGYVGALDIIAEYILANNVVFPAPKVVWSTAAPISAVQASKIEQAFGAPVCDQYGCSELYFIAAECPMKKGLHVFSDAVLVEILDDNNLPVPTGEFGRIVITNLNDKMFPLVRYANGDVGRMLEHTCSCEINYPLLDKVKGRVSDNISLPDGSVLSGEYLTTIFDDYTDEVKQFQIVQSPNNAITVKVVYKENTYGNQRKTINTAVEQNLSRFIKNQAPFSIEEVSHITMKKGKLQFIIKE
jgi:phenylacetate-CoA ligase